MPTNLQLSPWDKNPTAGHDELLGVNGPAPGLGLDRGERPRLSPTMSEILENIDTKLGQILNILKAGADPDNY